MVMTMDKKRKIKLTYMGKVIASTRDSGGLSFLDWQKKIIRKAIQSAFSLKEKHNA